MVRRRQAKDIVLPESHIEDDMEEFDDLTNQIKDMKEEDQQALKKQSADTPPESYYEEPTQKGPSGDQKYQVGETVTFYDRSGEQVVGKIIEVLVEDREAGDPESGEKERIVPQYHYDIEKSETGELFWVWEEDIKGPVAASRRRAMANRRRAGFGSWMDEYTKEELDNMPVQVVFIGADGNMTNREYPSLAEAQADHPDMSMSQAQAMRGALYTDEAGPAGSPCMRFEDAESYRNLSAMKKTALRLEDFQVGDPVTHAKWGDGEVTYVGSGPNGDKVSVDFTNPMQSLMGPAIVNPAQLQKGYSGTDPWGPAADDSAKEAEVNMTGRGIIEQGCPLCGNDLTYTSLYQEWECQGCHQVFQNPPLEMAAMLKTAELQVGDRVVFHGPEGDVNGVVYHAIEEHDKSVDVLFDETGEWDSCRLEKVEKVAMKKTAGFQIGDRVHPRADSMLTTMKSFGTVTMAEENGRVAVQWDGESKKYDIVDVADLESAEGVEAMKRQAKFKVGDHVEYQGQTGTITDLGRQSRGEEDPTPGLVTVETDDTGFLGPGSGAVVFWPIEEIRKTGMKRTASSKTQKIMDINNEIWEEAGQPESGTFMREEPWASKFAERVKSEVGPVDDDVIRELEDENYHSAIYCMVMNGLTTGTYYTKETYAMKRKAAFDVLPTIEDCEFEIVCEPEDMQPEGNASAIDEETDKQVLQEIYDKLESGNQWAWCSVHVICKWTDEDGQEYKGDDYLGGCSYKSEADFKEPGGYYDDMKQVAYDDMIKNMPAPTHPGREARRVRTAMKKTAETDWNELAQYLKERGVEICRLNGCTEEEHNCESYAYIDANGRLLDVCGSDYFQGSGEPYAAISLPFEGTGEELKNEVEEQTFDEFAGEDQGVSTGASRYLRPVREGVCPPGLSKEVKDKVKEEYGPDDPRTYQTLWKIKDEQKKGSRRVADVITEHPKGKYMTLSGPQDSQGNFVFEEDEVTENDSPMFDMLVMEIGDDTVTVRNKGGGIYETMSYDDFSKKFTLKKEGSRRKADGESRVIDDTQEKGKWYVIPQTGSDTPWVRYMTPSMMELEGLSREDVKEFKSFSTEEEAMKYVDKLAQDKYESVNSGMASFGGRRKAVCPPGVSKETKEKVKEEYGPDNPKTYQTLWKIKKEKEGMLRRIGEDMMSHVQACAICGKAIMAGSPDDLCPTGQQLWKQQIENAGGEVTDPNYGKAASLKIGEDVFLRDLKIKGYVKMIEGELITISNNLMGDHFYVVGDDNIVRRRRRYATVQDEVNDLERMKLRIEEQTKDTVDETQMQALEERLKELDREIGEANAKEAMYNPHFWDKVGEEIEDGTDKKLRSPSTEEVGEEGHDEQRAHPSKGEPGEGSEYRHEISAEEAEAPTLGGMPENVEQKVDAGEAGPVKFALDKDMFKDDHQKAMEAEEDAVVNPGKKKSNPSGGGYQSSAPFVGPSAMPGQEM